MNRRMLYFSIFSILGHKYKNRAKFENFEAF